VSDDEASAEAERMVRAGVGATSGHVGTARLGKRKRSKKTSHVAVGKVFFIDEEVAGRAREPHIVVETHETAAGEWPTGEAPFSRNPECCKWATAQSLADPTTDRVLPQNQLVPLNRHFEDRVQEHLGKGHLRGELCPSCRALIRAVQEVATGSVPPMVFASAWKRFAPKVAPPPLPDDDAGTAATVATGKHARGEEPSEAAAGAERRVAARRDAARAEDESVEEPSRAGCAATSADVATAIGAQPDAPGGVHGLPRANQGPSARRAVDMGNEAVRPPAVAAPFAAPTAVAVARRPTLEESASNS
jgi:hypothetical protein